MMRIAVLQMTTGIDPAANAATLVDAVVRAGEGGAGVLFTPEMSGLLDRDRTRGAHHIVTPEHSPVLAAVCNAAARAGITVALGSLAVMREDGRWAVQTDKTQRADSLHDRKSDAISRGKELAANKQTELLIKNESGQISAKHSYGNDPRSTKG